MRTYSSAICMSTHSCTHPTVQKTTIMVIMIIIRECVICSQYLPTRRVSSRTLLVGGLTLESLQYNFLQPDKQVANCQELKCEIMTSKKCNKTLRLHFCTWNYIYIYIELKLQGSCTSMFLFFVSQSSTISSCPMF